MPTWTKINNIWREQWSSHSKIDGIWRESDISVNIDGMWRQVYSATIDPSDIRHFRLIYERAKFKSHPEYPNMQVNFNVPATLHLTGSTSMDFDNKGVLFQYRRDGYEEGILMYEGNLYAMLTDGKYIRINSGNLWSANDERFATPYFNMPEAYGVSKMGTIYIDIAGYYTYENSGYYIAGWNNFFDHSKQIFSDNSSLSKEPERSTNIPISSILLPIDSRSPTYNHIAEIGIARNLSNTDNNMVGSYGILDQTIRYIRVDGIPRPFIIEIYE